MIRLDKVEFTSDIKDIPLEAWGELYLRHLNLTGRQAYFRQGFFGESATVAVFDTGVNPNHPELKGRVVGLLNYCGYGNGEDDHFHGTHVAGTIAGANVGVAPKAKILSVKVLDGGGGGTIDGICRALEEVRFYRTKEGRKLTAVSMSLSAHANAVKPDEKDRFQRAINNLTKDNIAVICSAGNSGRHEVRYPAAFPDPITVAAVDAEKLLPAPFTTINEEVDVCQIGIDVLSAWFEGGYRALSGTSMSTPIVSGILALISDKFFKIFKQELPEIVAYWMLKLNTKDIGIPGLDPVTGAGFCTLQPVTMDLTTRVGETFMTLNGEKIPLRAPIAVVPPGVTSLPGRELTTNVLGGITEYNEITKQARFRL